MEDLDYEYDSYEEDYDEHLTATKTNNFHAKFEIFKQIVSTNIPTSSFASPGSRTCEGARGYVPSQVRVPGKFRKAYIKYIVGKRVITLVGKKLPQAHVNRASCSPNPPILR